MEKRAPGRKMRYIYEEPVSTLAAGAREIIEIKPVECVGF
jgi:hypothetical protein